jgi:hypothetical protein
MLFGWPPVPACQPDIRVAEENKLPCHSLPREANRAMVSPPLFGVVFDPRLRSLATDWQA